MFGNGLFREFETDPFFRDQMEGMRQMQSMMTNMMGGMGGLMGQAPPQAAALPDPHAAAAAQLVPAAGFEQFPGMALMRNMNTLMPNMDMTQARNDPNAHFYTSSHVMSYSKTGDGQPKIYQASSQTQQVPGLVRETKKSVRDSEAGIEKMAVGHDIGDRSHTITRTRNTRTGDEEENQDYVNLDEYDVDGFNRQWREAYGQYGRAALAGVAPRVAPRPGLANGHARSDRRKLPPIEGPDPRRGKNSRPREKRDGHKDRASRKVRVDSAPKYER